MQTTADKSSPHQDAADLVAEVRWEAAHPMTDKDNWPSCALNAAADLIEQQAKALGEASQTCNSYSNRALTAEARLAEAMMVIERLTPGHRAPGCWCSYGRDIDRSGHEIACNSARSFLNSASNKEGAARAQQESSDADQ